MKFIIRILAIACLFQILDNFNWLLAVDGFGKALAASCILCLLELTLRPILIILTLPITILTFGLFLWFINGFIIWVTSSWIQGFQVGSFTSALMISILIRLTLWFVNAVFGERKSFFAVNYDYPPNQTAHRASKQEGKTIDLTMDKDGVFRKD